MLVVCIVLELLEVVVEIVEVVGVVSVVSVHPHWAVIHPILQLAITRILGRAGLGIVFKVNFWFKTVIYHYVLILRSALYLKLP